MEEQINIWPYFRSLFRHWFWIVGASIVAAIITFSIITFLPATYASTVLITVINPRELNLESLTLMEFEPQFRSVTDEDPLIRVYSELAISDKVTSDLFSEINPQFEEINSTEDLRRLLSANFGADPTLLRLTVRHSDPEIAANIANSWANHFIPWANDLFTIQVGQQVQFLEEQLNQVNSELEIIEEALTQFQGQNRSTIIETALNESIEAQNDYLALIRQMSLLQGDIQALNDQLAMATSVTQADQLAINALHLRVFNVEEANSLPIQDFSETTINRNLEDQLILLDNLLVTVESKQEKINGLLINLEPEILSLQQQYQEVNNEQNRLIRQQVTLNETYTALSRRIAEEKLSTQVSANGMQLVSQAETPLKPVDNNRILNSVIAGAVAFLGANFIILAMVWWQETGKMQLEIKEVSDE